LQLERYHPIIAEPCKEGTYRDSSMKSCEACGAGKKPEPNEDKTACGKISSYSYF
jgi:hypothetical protein